MISINYKDPRPIHEQVRNGFVRLISTGALGPDEKLPSVRELASSLAVNPNTIQKAYAWLESEGYVYSVSGRGSFVSSTDAAAKKRTEDLLTQMDEVIWELKELSVNKETLKKRIDGIYVSKKSGGDKSDKG